MARKATFAMGCFWGPDGFFGCVPGVIRTRVGYCGGALPNPTYHNLGDHTEAIDVDYDPNVTSYDALLKVFWEHHDPTGRYKTQYKSAIYYHDEEQKALGQQTKEEQGKKRHKTVLTEILPSLQFYNAEGYHQKYHLQTFHPELCASIGLTEKKLVETTVAARLSGYVTGNGTMEAFEKECDSFGLPQEMANYVRKQIKSPNRGVC